MRSSLLVACLTLVTLTTASLVGCVEDPKPTNRGTRVGNDDPSDDDDTGSSEFDPDNDDDGQPDDDTASVDSLPWETTGVGVASKDTQNPAGTNAVIVYAGYGADLEAAKAWSTALYKADLRERGVRYIYAVQGPENETYSKLEIENTAIIAKLLPQIASTTKFVMLVAHGSGSYVAQEILRQFTGSLDPNKVSKGKLVYFDLDGSPNVTSGKTNFTTTTALHLRKAYFVAARDQDTSTDGKNNGAMQQLATDFSSIGSAYVHDASGAGCSSGAKACVHSSLVITKPHSPTEHLASDYSDFSDDPVTTGYIIAKASEAGLAP